jgi:outer membrane protein TolC
MKKTVFILGLSCFVINTFAQTKEADNFSFSVQQAINFAMENQNNIKNSVIDEEIANQKVKEIFGMGLPQISSSFDTKDFIEIPTSVVPASAFGGPVNVLQPVRFGTKYQSSAGFDASQLLFSGDYFLGLQASKVYVDLSSKATQRTKIETAATVSKAYYTVLLNEERMKLMDANIIRVNTALDGTKGLYLTGFVEKIDLDRLTVTYNNLLVEKEKIGRLLDLGKYLLKYQMGMNSAASLTLTDKLSDVKFDVGNSVTADKFEYTKRVEFNLLETQRKLAFLDFKRNRFTYLPTAFIYGALSANAFRNKYTFFDTKLGWYPTALIGAKVTLPIFTGFQRNAKTQQSKLSLQKAENNIESLKKSIDLELVNSMTMLQNASASLENQKKNIVVAEDVYRVSKMKYEQGVGTYIEMLTSETSLKEAQTNYISALYDALIAKIDYDKANGELGTK